MDDNDIRLAVVCAVLNANITSGHISTQEANGAAVGAMLIADRVLELWRNLTPYAPEPKCAHGRRFSEDCALCAAGIPVAATLEPQGPELKPLIMSRPNTCIHGVPMSVQCSECC